MLSAVNLGWGPRQCGFWSRFRFQSRRHRSCKKRRLQGDQTILEQQKPEAAYFIAEGGRRTGILILNMNDASELARIAEPWFLALNASIEATPAMLPEDLQRAAPAIEQAVKTFG